ncbi:putative toxin-antitoxin system toxin component, PIN family [Marispirochaeta sp.]|uniref:putative toxin-antitoxin system toxin component, PIN family n=1 Tax=Marispirochaeta sp. TaxID=2038653 RepID=UPI0029C8915E|nr:putative toxin-antitoxin system toxin component, PIN family [Marispirochaeta sp.]
MIEAVVLDTNVVLSGLRSRNGYAFKVLEFISEGIIRPVISVPLILEYETVLNHHREALGLDTSDISDFLDYICKVADKVKIYYLWRPILKDPYDDHILEVAVGSECKYIMSYNKKDFIPVGSFGIEVVTPKEYMEIRGYI